MTQFEGDAFSIQDPHHDLFTQNGRQRADTQVDFAAADPDVQPSVLWLSVLGDIQFRHHLDPRNDRGVHFLARFHDLSECTIDAETNRSEFLSGFDVNVAGPVIHGPINHVVHELHHRGQSRDLLQVCQILNLLLDDLHIALIDALDNVIDLERGRISV